MPCPKITIAHLLCLIIAILPCVGCSLWSGVEVRHIKSSVQKPSNVAFYVSVRDGSEPVTDLLPENFRIYENEQLLSKGQSQLTLLDRKLASAHHTLLLLDLSEARDPRRRDALTAGAASFITRIRRSQTVSLFAFDGGKHIHFMGRFPAMPEGAPASKLSKLSTYATHDNSRNLNGAVIQALKKLDTYLKRSNKPVRVGTLVVLSFGPDVAGRVEQQEMFDVLDETEHDVFAIGKKPGEYELDEIGKTGVIWAEPGQNLKIAFENAAIELNKAYERHYLVSYCSPSRAGQRRVRIEVSYTTVEGEERTGELEREFIADGFRSGCDPESVPRFYRDTLELGAARAETSVPGHPAPPGAHQRRHAPTGAQSEEPDSETVPEAPGEDVIVPPPDAPGYE